MADGGGAYAGAAGADMFERFMPLAEQRLAERRLRTPRAQRRERAALKKRQFMLRMLALGSVLAGLGVVAFVAFLRWLRRRKRREARRAEIVRACAAERPGETIFVSLPSYRDPEAAHTLRSLFARASCPSRVYVGLCQQNAPGDADALGSYATLAGRWNDPFTLADNVRVLRLSAEEARGPCLARELIEEKLYRGERYVLHIDAHTMFAQDWDRILIDELEATGDPKAVLTSYPPTYALDERHTPSTAAPAPPTFPYLSHVDDEGMPRFLRRRCTGRPLRPFPVTHWCACFSFARAEMLREVPYLADVPFLFFGEEDAMGARLWTNGWNLYAPSRMPLHTTFDRSYRSTFWEVRHADRQRLRRRSVRRVQAMLGYGVDSNIGPSAPEGIVGPGALGAARPVAAFWKMVGINPQRRTATPAALLGLTADASTDEILNKYGSMEEYYVALRAAGGSL